MHISEFSLFFAMILHLPQIIKYNNLNYTIHVHVLIWTLHMYLYGLLRMSWRYNSYFVSSLLCFCFRCFMEKWNIRYVDHILLHWKRFHLDWVLSLSSYSLDHFRFQTANNLFYVIANERYKRPEWVTKYA